MSDYSIGIRGLMAAQKELDVIGNNIANAATEGYHRQRIELSPSVSVREGSIIFGRGVDVKSVARMIDGLLEQEILRQQSSLSQVDREVVTLQTVESVLGELSTENVVDSINTLAGQIAELNSQIQGVEVGGGSANNLRDERDKLISDMAELV